MRLVAFWLVLIDSALYKTRFPECKDTEKMTMVLNLRDYLDNPLLRDMPTDIQQEGSPMNALIHFAGLGHYVTCRWLISVFKITVRDVRAAGNAPLLRAVTNGHLELSQMLSNEFALNRLDAIVNDNEALRMAATNGHLQMCMWLTDEFKLTRSDAMANHNEALHGANKNGHHQIVLWLITRFDMPAPKGQ